MPLDGGTGPGRPPGREPVYFRHEFCEQAYNLQLLNLSEGEMAKFFGVLPQTIVYWKRRYPAFAEAVFNGGVKADAEVARGYFKRATGYEFDSEKVFCTKHGEIIRAPTVEHVVPDPGAARQWLAGRQPELWAQRATVDVNLTLTDTRERNLKLIEAVATRVVEGPAS